MTIPTQLVLRALLADPSQELYGVEIGQAAGLPSGTVHPILARLEGVGWLTSRWEDIDPRAEGRPARRYYQLTSDGIELARAALARAYSATARPAWLRPLGRRVMTALMGSRGTGQAGQPTWWASLAVRSASLPLPSEHRYRYRQEFLAELYGMTPAEQLHHATGIALSRLDPASRPQRAGTAHRQGGHHGQALALSDWIAPLAHREGLSGEAVPRMSTVRRRKWNLDDPARDARHLERGVPNPTVQSPTLIRSPIARCGYRPRRSLLALAPRPGRARRRPPQARPQVLGHDLDW